MEAMWRGGVCTGVAIVSLLVGGCGVAGSATGADGAAVARPSDGSVSTAPPVTGYGIDSGNDVGPADGAGSVGEDQPGPTFPMTVRRTGGIADYADRVVVQSDGRVTVDTRALTGRRCTLAAAQRAQLLSALTALRITPPLSSDTPTDTPSDGSTGPPAAGSTPPADAREAGDPGPITLSVTDDLARTFDLTDTSLAGVTDLLGSVVTNVTLTLPAGAACTTPGAPTKVPTDAPVPAATTRLTAAG